MWKLLRRTNPTEGSRHHVEASEKGFKLPELVGGRQRIPTDPGWLQLLSSNMDSVTNWERCSDLSLLTKR